MAIGKIYLHNYLLSMIITDLPYFGPISFWETIATCNTICFDLSAPFSKMSFKNRMIIASAQGPLHLTIPIIGGRDQKTPLQDIRIAYDTPWNLQHYKAILSSYQRSPYFEYYRDSIEALYHTKPEYLVDFLMQCQFWSKKQLKGNWEIITQTTNLVISTKDNTNKNITDLDNHNIIQRLYPTSLPKNYANYPKPITYQQVFQETTGFLPNLSILDILFCCGGKFSLMEISTVK